MRETRSSGSVEGVMSNRDPYSDSVVRLELLSRGRSHVSPGGNHVSAGLVAVVVPNPISQRVGGAVLIATLRGNVQVSGPHVAEIAPT
jgi:hypothetical protein